MLDERKVKLMTRMASYEQNKGKEDFKISAYYRKDYVSLHRLYSFFWMTIGYILVWALIIVGGFDTWMEKMSLQLILVMGLTAVIGYLVVLLVYLVTASRLYNKKHQDARMRVKKYNHDLTRLLKIYEKENQ